MANITSTQQSLQIRLGSDLTFPIAGNFIPINGLNLLIQDIQQLLLTMPGERVNRPDYGCTLRAQIWENLQETAISGQSSIRQALTNFEPRISLLNVTSSVNVNTGLINFNILFVVNTVDTPINLIFPFRSGTSLSFA